MLEGEITEGKVCVCYISCSRVKKQRPVWLSVNLTGIIYPGKRRKLCHRTTKHEESDLQCHALTPL